MLRLMVVVGLLVFGNSFPYTTQTRFSCQESEKQYVLQTTPTPFTLSVQEGQDGDLLGKILSIEYLYTIPMKGIVTKI